MSEHIATIDWQRTSDDFSYDTYNRDHQWHFEHGLTLEASSAPAYLGNPNRLDPEEAFVASVASCHMLTFLALAAKKRFTVDSYQDRAIGLLDTSEDNKMMVTKINLYPKIHFTGEKQPTKEDITAMHHKAHDVCFIANSIKTKVIIHQ